MGHFARQLELGAEALGRHEEFARLREASKRLVELVDELGAATPGEAIARKREQLAERGDANGGEKRGVDAQHLER